MQKIISLFQRNYETDHLVRNQVVPGAEWVLAGEGKATRKYDGSCCLVRDGKLYKRYDAKKGKTPPPGFEPAQEPDPVTGHQPGWVPVGDGPDDKWHRAAFERMSAANLHPGFDHEFTCELLGPKVQGNAENFTDHVLLPHCSIMAIEDCPRDFDGIRDYFRDRDIEGVVWHHPDGRMVKIKKKDFGFKR